MRDEVVNSSRRICLYSARVAKCPRVSARVTNEFIFSTLRLATAKLNTHYKDSILILLTCQITLFRLPDLSDCLAMCLAPPLW